MAQKVKIFGNFFQMRGTDQFGLAIPVLKRFLPSLAFLKVGAYSMNKSRYDFIVEK
jgi:hypothetical protein